VLPFLRRQGIQRLDALFISHPNIDHYNAAPDICRNFPVDKVYISDHFTRGLDTNANGAAVRKLLDELKKIGQPVQTVSRGWELKSQTQNSDWRVEMAWPPQANAADELDDNNASLVLRIIDRNGAILLCGDIAAAGQRGLLKIEKPDQLRSNILLLPHHGSVAESLPDFVTAVQPELVLTSSSPMRKSSLDKLSTAVAGARTLHTFECGEIMAVLTNQGLQTRTFHQPPQQTGQPVATQK
jgi:competence protein ComEC